MTKLNKRQKKILAECADEYFEQTRGYLDIDSLPYDVYEKVVAINDHETIYQNIERFLWDYRFEQELTAI